MQPSQHQHFTPVRSHTRHLVGMIAVLGLLASMFTTTPANAGIAGCPIWFVDRGLGTPSSPYLVTDQLDLVKVSLCLSSTFRQTTDITLITPDTPGWTPIGTDTAPFTGTYDGGGFNISGLRISLPTTNNVGLFGYINSATLTGVNITTSTGTVTGIMYVGGLVGNSLNSTITESSSSVNVVGVEAVGGLIGATAGGTVSYSYATGDVTATANYVGGLVGQASGVDVNDVYATGSVFGDWQIGGLFGEFFETEGPPPMGSVTNSYAKGYVSGISGGGAHGGFIGQSKLRIFDSFWDTQTSRQANGGFAVPGSSVPAGKLTSEMKNLSTYLTPVTTVSWSIASGFDTSKTWGLCPDVNDGYPFLTVFYDTNPCAEITPSPEPEPEPGPGPGPAPAPAPAGDPTPLVTPGPVNIVAVSAEQGVREVPGRTVAPGIVVVSNELASGVAPKQASTPAGPGVKNAPVIQSRLGEIVRVSVNGLGNSRALIVAIQTADGWVKIGETKTDVNGAAILPALSSILAGDVLIRTKGPKGKLRYVIVRFS